MTKLGLTIKVFRTKKELSIKQVVALCDISYSYYREIEQGHRDPSMKTLAKIAKALDVRL